MKSIITQAMALVITSVMLFSFSAGFGGEGFEISLNNKLVIQRYGKNMEDVKSLQLNQYAPNDKLTIRYHHCGKVGKNRTISVKGPQNKIIKEWRYTDAAEPLGPMTFEAKDILGIKNIKSGDLKLYYSSSELPNGRVLASISMSNSNLAAK